MSAPTARPAHSDLAGQTTQPRTVRTTGWLLFAGLMCLYIGNDAIVEEGDAVANIGVPVALLKHGGLSFDPISHPEMFDWHAQAPMTAGDNVYVRNWFWIFDNDFAFRWRDQGKLLVGDPRYYVVESTRFPGRYVSTFGPIPGLTMVPMVGALLLIDKKFPYKSLLRWSIGKLHAAAMVAASAVLVFLIGLRFSSFWAALLCAIGFALGTPAWVVLSQSIWQQTVNVFFLMLSVYLLFATAATPRNARWAGVAMGVAVACRHSSLLMLAPIGLYLLWRERSRVWNYALGVMPAPLLIAGYNTYYFASPLNFGQELIGHSIALDKTGSPDVWQTPLLDGLTGLLLSPSRGVVIFSPFLLLAGWGLWRIWRRPDLEWLRPLTIGVVAMMGIQCKWFDWWGGWSYGYRPWLDSVAMLALFAAAVVPTVISRTPGSVLFGITLGWSISIQALGALAYDKTWNARTMHVVETSDGDKRVALDTIAEARALALFGDGEVLASYNCNVDQPNCRYRLWTTRDNIVTYHIKNFPTTRSNRWTSGWRQLTY